jgi:hypothetical protein
MSESCVYRASSCFTLVLTTSHSTLLHCASETAGAKQSQLLAAYMDSAWLFTSVFSWNLGRGSPSVLRRVAGSAQVRRWGHHSGSSCSRRNTILAEGSRTMKPNNCLGPPLEERVNVTCKPRQWAMPVLASYRT